MTGFKSNSERRSELGTRQLGNPAVEISGAIDRLKVIDHYSAIRFDAVEFYCNRLLFGRLLTQIDKTVSTDVLAVLNPEEAKTAFILLLRDMMQQHRKHIVTEHESQLFETARIEQFTVGLIYEARAQMEPYLQWLDTISGDGPEPTEILMRTLAPQLGLGAQRLIDEQDHFVTMVRAVVFMPVDDEETPEHEDTTMPNAEIQRLVQPKPPARTREAIERRFKSMMRLRSERVHVNDELPVIESETNTHRRTTNEVADRAMALLLVSSKADWIQQGLTAEQIASSVREVRTALNVDRTLSPLEQAFLDSIDDAASADRFTWRYEALWVLLWALGYVESLDRPIKECDVERSSKQILDLGPEAFVAQATLRPQHEILDECDLIYRYEWACVDSQLNERPLAELNPSVVQQRHWALNWLIGYRGQAWDNISTDI